MVVPQQIDFYKAVTGVLAGIIVTGAVSWFTLGDGWQRDKGEIVATIAATAKSVERLEGIVSELTRTTQKLTTAQEVATTKHEVLVAQMSMLADKMDRVLDRAALGVGR